MKIRNTLIVFLIAVLICVPLRAYQLLSLDDYSAVMGSDKSIISWVLGGLLCVFAIVMFALSLSSHEFPSFSPRRKSAFMGILSILTGLAVGYDIGRWSQNKQKV